MKSTEFKLIFKPILFGVSQKNWTMVVPFEYSILTRPLALVNLFRTFDSIINYWKWTFWLVSQLFHLVLSIPFVQHFAIIIEFFFVRFSFIRQTILVNWDVESSKITIVVKLCDMSLELMDRIQPQIMEQSMFRISLG